MDQSTTQAGGQSSHMHDGDDFVCSNCGCEIMLKHHGDESKMQSTQPTQPFTCCCGTKMEPEHASQS